jgi:hypothetical protein
MQSIDRVNLCVHAYQHLSTIFPSAKTVERHRAKYKWQNQCFVDRNGIKKKYFTTMADFEDKLDSFDLRKEIEAIDPR